MKINQINPYYKKYQTSERKNITKNQASNMQIKQHNFAGLTAENAIAFFGRNYQLEKGQFLRYGEIFISDFTNYARDDMDWVNLGKYIKSKYKDIGNTDINIFGCSTGEEAYTMAILLNKLYKETPFKIKAMDINKTAIGVNRQLQDSGIFLNDRNYTSLVNGLGLSERLAEKYMEKIGNKKYRINDEIVSRVEFEKANILTSIHEINSEKPCIVMARNMWPYIQTDEYESFARELYDRLAPGSIFIIGEFDINGFNAVHGSDQFPTTLIDAGFKNPKRKISKDLELDKRLRRYIFEK